MQSDAKNRRSHSQVLTVWILFLLIATTLIARTEELPTSSPGARNVRISFLPPPLEGTISLGIYDASGKLVRVLHREADINDFTIGNDALSTSWDGKNDAGEDLPAGKYSAHGFVVGDLGVEGVGFFFNDFVTSDDSPRFSRIDSVKLRGDDLLLGVELISRGAVHVLYNAAHKSIKLTDDAATEPSPLPPIANVLEPVATALGRDGTRWVIDRIAKGSSATELKQFAANGDFLRRLEISPGEPQPIAVAASLKEDKIFLLEQSNAMQRVRGLSLVGAKTEGATQPISDWKVDFEKKIIAHKDFSLVDGKPVAVPSAEISQNQLKIKLQPNPLAGDERATVEVTIGFDVDGSFLKTNDGLPLCSISETPDLVRGLLVAHGENALDVFQDDGAVVEQFKVSGVDQMMSFDCGGFELM